VVVKSVVEDGEVDNGIPLGSYVDTGSSKPQLISIWHIQEMLIRFGASMPMDGMILYIIFNMGTVMHEVGQLRKLNQNNRERGREVSQ